jgi:hypothetical protein
VVKDIAVLVRMQLASNFKPRQGNKQKSLPGSGEAFLFVEACLENELGRQELGFVLVHDLVDDPLIGLVLLGGHYGADRER